MTKIKAEILRDAALRPSSIKVKGLTIDYEYYPSGAVSAVILEGKRASLPRLFEVLNMIYPRDITVSIRGSAWYDRNPKTILKSYVGSAIAPHLTTERWSYTVPAGRKAFIESVTLDVSRVSAAAPQAIAIIHLDYTPEGESTETLEFVFIITNTTGDRDKDSTGHSGIMQQGDKIICYTRDDSAGGTVRYAGIVKFTEFDA